MNKTVNINLAGVFFHIDEDAYAKLQHYLDAIKQSLASTQGREEILADIEARIAELFSERMKDKRQVVSAREVEEVIAIMGQPEDYMVDEEMFEDEQTYRPGKTSKQLFRDTEHGYVGGVSSGLGHYLGISAIWIRLLWILLTIFSSGAFILIYIALWIFVPEAKTTADKLAMRGEEVNISNIEKRIREGFDDVAGKVRSVDYDKYSKKAKSGASSAATSVGSVISFLLKIIAKLIGILLLLLSGSVLIGLFIAIFTVGTFGLVEAPWTDYVEMAVIGAPLWIIAVLSFLAVGIPFFFLFILGLKILVRKLKTIGTTAKLVLLGVWLLSVIGLSVIGVQQATTRAFEEEVAQTQSLNLSSQDTLFLAMQNDSRFSSNHRTSGLKIFYDEQDKKVIHTSDVRFALRSTKDSLGRIEILKTSSGKDPKNARSNAEEIEYKFEQKDNQLLLNSFLITDLENHFMDQQVRITIYLPEGSTIYADRNTGSFHRYSASIMDRGETEEYLKIAENEAVCLSCPAKTEDGWDEDSWKDNEEVDIKFEGSSNSGADSLVIRSKNGKLKISVDRN